MIDRLNYGKFRDVYNMKRYEGMPTISEANLVNETNIYFDFIINEFAQASVVLKNIHEIPRKIRPRETSNEILNHTVIIRVNTCRSPTWPWCVNIENMTEGEI